MNRVNYQPDSLDKFIHKYIYDKDNRLTEVYTSLDGLLWEQDARYEYYKHGPLARTELGELQVQGVDYAYTINGWLKGINAGVIDSTRDMGLDGLQSNWHAVFPADVYGSVLGYFSGDYKAAGRNASGFSAFEPAYASSGFNSDAGDLFNGNIRSMTLHLSRFDTIGYTYRYDQLNRLTKMNMWDNLNTATYAWSSGGNPLNDYKERVSYDANGNILSYIRNAVSIAGNPVYMDSLTYNYYPNSNKLKYVDDPITAGRFAVDIDDQADSNYVYDKIGNLVADSSEGLAVSWYVNGKVKQIVNSNTDTVVTFSYDPMGNRISKRVETNTDTITTFYVRDAQGNILADYSLRKDTIKWSEMAMYGSSRLGLQLPDTIVYPCTWTDTGRIQYPNYIGRKNYELTNHLGNVLSTINDWKNGADSDTDQVVDYWQAVLMSQQDYYPFGMVQPNRNWTGNDYRFGFNGKEKDDEAKGKGNSLDFGARIYDPRLGRFLSVDPLFRSFASWSTFSAFNNNPILMIDPTGKGAKVTREQDQNGETILKVTATIFVYSDCKEISDKINGDGGYAQMLQNQINAAYNIDATGKIGREDDTKSLKIVFDVRVQQLGDGTVESAKAAMAHMQENGLIDESMNFIQLHDNAAQRSSFTIGNSGSWSVAQSAIDRGTPAHEFAHILGWLRNPTSLTEADDHAAPGETSVTRDAPFRVSLSDFKENRFNNGAGLGRKADSKTVSLFNTVRPITNNDMNYRNGKFSQSVGNTNNNKVFENEDDSYHYYNEETTTSP